uniref:Spindle and centriole-associated protein 1 n=1 Tax=Knipowitschia caucasica TaxID=637954 RepID=A0AAV2L3X1_KNICA
MSSVRFGRQQPLPKGKKTIRPKKTAPPKKEWVSTVNDLSVHKLTPAEVNYRHERMKSHNTVSAQWELREKALKRRLRHGSPSPLDSTSLSIIREVLSDQMLLQDVLARSDRAMSVVKDIFGDSPRRQTGHPSVTMAPSCNSDSLLPVFQRPDAPTELSQLSQSMMDPQALNEIKDSSEEDCDPINCSNDVIQRANIRKIKSRTTGKVVRKQTGNSILVTPKGKAPDKEALNATVAVQRIRRSQSRDLECNDGEMISQVLNPGHPLGSTFTSVRKTKKCADRSSELDGSSFASLNGDQSSLGLLQCMLGQVEADLDFCSPDTVPTSDQCPKRTKGLTGFSVALVSTLGRLVHILKQNKAESQKAAVERARIEGQLTKQHNLIEALKAENTALRDDTAALQSCLQQRISEIEEKVDTVVLVIGSTEMPCITTQEPDIPTASLTQAERDQTHTTPVVLPPLPQQTTDNWPHVAGTLITPQPHSNLRLTSTSPRSSVSSKVSAKAMMAEIEQLSRQNELIKAQLAQAKGLTSMSANSSYLEETRLSCGSTDSPQNGAGRRDSKSTQPPASEQADTSVLNMSSVEQRLLELNRQSAAARTRLLDIIDQQQHMASVKLSPSVSPAPHSALDRRASSEISVLQEHMLPTKQSASNEPSPSQSLRSEGAKDIQSSPEGWFSLSTHLR